MKKAILGIIFCVLLMIPVPSIAYGAKNTVMNDPLTIRAEVKKIGDSNRIFSLRAYATNTWNE